MKHFYPALLALAPAALNAQIQITSADMPMIGDEIVRYLDTLPDFTPGGDGPDQLWDFSTAVQDLEETNTFVDPATTADGDQFGGSNLAWTTDGNNYSFLTNGAGELTLDGFSGDPLGDGTFTIVAPFNPGMTLHSFPRQHTTAFTDDFGFDVTVDGSDFGVYQARIKETSTVYDTTDAYGSITTPVGTYDCIRSRSTTIRTDSIFAQLLEILPMTFLFEIVDTSTTYAWHAVETKLPVAEMILDSTGAAVSFTWSTIEPNSTGVHAVAAANDLLLFPQPATDRVRISAGDALLSSITVSELGGRVVMRNARLSNNGELDLSGVPAGLYVLSAQDANGRTRTRRLSVAR